MGRIAASFFLGNPHISGPVFTLVLFFVVFVIISIRTIRTKPMELTSDAALPLADEVLGDVAGWSGNSTRDTNSSGVKEVRAKS